MADPTLAAMLEGAASPVASEPSWHDRYVKPLGSAYPRQPYAWTKDYPGLAKFLGEGVPQALMGVRGPMAASAEVVPIPSSTLRSQVGVTGNLPRRIDLPTLRDQLAWKEMSGDKSAALNVRDLNYALDQLGDHAPPRNPANSNAPRTSVFADPAGGRFQQALDNGGTPPTVDLHPLTRQYLDALQGPGRRSPALTVIDGGKPPLGLFPKKD